MKITIGRLSFDLLLFLRLCLPATLFVGVCTGVLLAFRQILLLLDQIAPHFIGGAWLALLIFYLILGGAFTRFVAHRLRASFGSQEWHIQQRMAILSGLPFYALCLLCLMATILSFLLPDINALTAFVSLVGFVGFTLVSGSYLLLLHFFLLRPTVRN